MLLRTIRHILVKVTAVKIIRPDWHNFIVDAASAFLVYHLAIGAVRVDIFALQHTVLVEISLA